MGIKESEQRKTTCEGIKPQKQQLQSHVLSNCVSTTDTELTHFKSSILLHCFIVLIHICVFQICI